MTLTEAQIVYLRKLAAEDPVEHDDLFGESPDDAYAAGLSDGKSDLARELLGESA